MTEKSANGAKPFLKWAGGKSQLLTQFRAFYPEELKKGEIKNYIEPFIGGGAVFFDIVQKYDIQSAYLYDINKELIIAYRVVQKDAEMLVEFLNDLSKKYKTLTENDRKDFYYKIRADYNNQRVQIGYDKYSENWIPRAAQIIFLNKTCYNGLFRFNRSGEFNVPFGKYKNPKILDEVNIYNVARVLQSAKIQATDFQACEKIVDEKSFVYFDPPYRPISQTSSFTSYSKHEFGDTEQIRLSKFFRKLAKKYAAKLMLSNSDPTNENPDDQFFKELYNGFNIHKVNANRMINSNAGKRGQIFELLILNYQE